MKVIYLNPDELKEQFLANHPEHKGKKLIVEILDSQYNIRMGKRGTTVLALQYPPEGCCYKERGRVYGYCRISTNKQKIDRQIQNISALYPSAVIVQEVYSGRKKERPEWKKLLGRVMPGDVIVFDSVSRMSRDADDGVKTYFDLYEKGIQLVFLKEHYIDTEVYSESKTDKIPLQGTDEDEIFIGLNNYFRKLAERQIRIAFEQADKEVKDLRQRTKEGIDTARRKGKQIGQRPGNKLHIKKRAPAMEKIRKYSRDFDGSLPDAEVMKLVGLSRNTYYKYKREIVN